MDIILNGRPLWIGDPDPMDYDTSLDNRFTLYGVPVSVNLPTERPVRGEGEYPPEYALVSVPDRDTKDDRFAEVLADLRAAEEQVKETRLALARTRDSNQILRKGRVELLEVIDEKSDRLRAAADTRHTLDTYETTIESLQADLKAVREMASVRGDELRATKALLRLESENLSAAKRILANLQREVAEQRIGLAKVRAIVGTKTTGATREGTCYIPRCRHLGAGRDCSASVLPF